MLSLNAHSNRTPESGRVPLLILHGMFGAGDNWTGIARELGQEYPVFTMDLPGHGLSRHPAGSEAYPERPFFYPVLADLIAQSLEGQFPGQRWALCGHSMGGKAAMALALRHPGLVGRCLVADTAPRSYVGSGLNEEVLAMLAGLELDGFDSRLEVDAAMKKWIVDPVMRGFLLKSLAAQADGSHAWRFDADLILKGARDIADWPDADFAPDQIFGGPSLFVRGSLSPYIVPERDDEAIGKRFPAYALKTIEGARHWVHFDNKAQFVALTREFMV